MSDDYAKNQMFLAIAGFFDRLTRLVDELEHEVKDAQTRKAAQYKVNAPNTATGGIHIRNG